MCVCEVRENELHRCRAFIIYWVMLQAPLLSWRQMVYAAGVIYSLYLTDKESEVEGNQHGTETWCVIFLGHKSSCEWSQDPILLLQSCGHILPLAKRSKKIEQQRQKVWKQGPTNLGFGGHATVSPTIHLLGHQANAATENNHKPGGEWAGIQKHSTDRH